MDYPLIETATDEEFIGRSVDAITDVLREAIAKKGSAMLGLSGGSTPRLIYEALGQRTTVDWTKVSIFLIDERYTAATDEQSNQYLVRNSLLKHAAIPERSCFFPDTTLPLPACVMQYAAALHGLWQPHLPDLMVLGMGDDGHIASLFPPLAPDLMDDTQLVVHTTTDRFAVHDRVTLTLNPIICANAHVLILQGQAKKSTWEAMMKSTEGPERWPFKGMEPVNTLVITHW